jgi:hypothetical protein
MIILPPLEGVHWLAFGWKARSGKNVCAEAIHASDPERTRVIGFADALKAYARVARGMTHKDGGLLQQLGTNEFRAKDPDIWVRILYWTVEELRPQIVLVPDCRFPNEAEFIKSQGGAVVGVRRYHADGSLYLAPDRPADHPSEVALDAYEEWDYIIRGKSGEVEALKRQALWVYQRLLERWRVRPPPSLVPLTLKRMTID